MASSVATLAEPFAYLEALGVTVVDSPRGMANDRDPCAGSGRFAGGRGGLLDRRIMRLMEQLIRQAEKSMLDKLRKR